MPCLRLVHEQPIEEEEEKESIMLSSDRSSMYEIRKSPRRSDICLIS